MLVNFQVVFDVKITYAVGYQTEYDFRSQKRTIESVKRLLFWCCHICLFKRGFLCGVLHDVVEDDDGQTKYLLVRLSKYCSSIKICVSLLLLCDSIFFKFLWKCTSYDFDRWGGWNQPKSIAFWKYFFHIFFVFGNWIIFFMCEILLLLSYLPKLN